MTVVDVLVGLILYVVSPNSGQALAAPPVGISIVSNVAGEAPVVSGEAKQDGEARLRHFPYNSVRPAHFPYNAKKSDHFPYNVTGEGRLLSW